MRKRRPGRRLAIALPEDPPRWLDFSLWLGLIAACLVPLGYFVGQVRSGTVSKNAGLLEVVFGLLGLFALVRLVRVTVLQILAGSIRVEVAAEPARCRHPLDLLIASRRPFAAELVCLQARGRSGILVRCGSVPLGSGELQTVDIPALPAAVDPRELWRVIWRIEIRIRFARGFVLELWYPLEVDMSTSPGAGPT